MKATKERAHVRLNLPATLVGAVDLRHDVKIINLSLQGAMIAHANRLAPGWTCLLSLRLLGVDLQLGSRIVWSQVNGIHSDSTGEGKISFRSGLHFVDPPEKAQAVIRQYLTTLKAPQEALL